MCVDELPPEVLMQVVADEDVALPLPVGGLGVDDADDPGR
jgi:hypothetical protein